ncbi:hypothetical protein KUCAC02_035106, partial [Chaenocephalus aceratus]
HDIRVHRQYYRLPEATTQLAKISKLLLAMEKGSLKDLQGKTLEEIQIEGMETARRPVEEPPGTSDGMETARRPVEEPPGTSDALNTNADENDKEPGRRGDMHEPP